MNDRRGNPSDPIEEAERVRKAFENVQNWQRKYQGEFSGGVSMQMGSGKKYVVPIGDREIAQKVVSRPLPPQSERPVIPAGLIVGAPLTDLPSESAMRKALDAKMFANFPGGMIRPHRSWFKRIIDRIFGENT